MPAYNEIAKSFDTWIGGQLSQCIDGEDLGAGKRIVYPSILSFGRFTADHLTFTTLIV
jgi:hypothetical protein